MSRYRRPTGHKDANHDQVVRDLRAAGCSVLETHALGDGAPDLIVGWHGVTALVELKNGARYHATVTALRARAERQTAYLDAWRGGPAFLATTTEAILVALDLAARERRA